MDRQPASCLACGRGRAVGNPDLRPRMVRSGPAVSVLAADLHIAAALLDRLPRSPFLGIHVSVVRLASSLSLVFEGRTFLRVCSFGAICGLLGLGAAALFAAHVRELPWAGREPTIDQAFMRHMSTHHEQGILLASIAAERAGDPHLRGSARQWKNRPCPGYSIRRPWRNCSQQRPRRLTVRLSS
jgi:hypothetical protein